MTILGSIIYWARYPFRNSYKNKVMALLEGLGAQNIDKFMKEGKTGDYRHYGTAYSAAWRAKIKNLNN